MSDRGLLSIYLVENCEVIFPKRSCFIFDDRKHTRSTLLGGTDSYHDHKDRTWNHQVHGEVKIRNTDVYSLPRTVTCHHFVAKAFFSSNQVLLFHLFISLNLEK